MRDVCQVCECVCVGGCTSYVAPCEGQGPGTSTSVTSKHPLEGTLCTDYAQLTLKGSQEVPSLAEALARTTVPLARTTVPGWGWGGMRGAVRGPM